MLIRAPIKRQSLCRFLAESDKNGGIVKKSQHPFNNENKFEEAVDKKPRFSSFCFSANSISHRFFLRRKQLTAPFINFSLSQKLLLIFLLTSVKVMSVKIERQRI